MRMCPKPQNGRPDTGRSRRKRFMRWTRAFLPYFWPETWPPPDGSGTNCSPDRAELWVGIISRVPKDWMGTGLKFVTQAPAPGKTVKTGIFLPFLNASRLYHMHIHSDNFASFRSRKMIWPPFCWKFCMLSIDYNCRRGLIHSHRRLRCATLATG